eukprot:255884_1
MQDMLQQCDSKNQLMVNPPYIYDLDSKLINNDNNDQGCIAIALGNGSIALYAPTIKQQNDDDDDEKEKEKEKDDEDIVDDPICCVEMHKSAVCDISFGYNNDWLVSAGTDKFLMISDWKLDKNELSIKSQFKIPLTQKPNSMVCTGNDIAQIVVADLSNNLSMYALKQ